MREYKPNPQSLVWWRTLNSNQKINLKSMFIDLCGTGWSEVGVVLSLREKIDVMHLKLRKEGIDV